MTLPTINVDKSNVLKVTRIKVELTELLFSVGGLLNSTENRNVIHKMAHENISEIAVNVAADGASKITIIFRSYGKFKNKYPPCFDCQIGQGYL